MPLPRFAKSALGAALLAGAFGLSASAQEYGPGPGYGGPPPESVIVTAPRFCAEPAKLNGPLEPVSLSMAVRYDDLDIATRRGAREFRHRVYRQAENVCDRLADAYPVYEMTSAPSCFKSAVDNAMTKASAAINEARLAYWEGD